MSGVLTVTGQKRLTAENGKVSDVVARIQAKLAVLQPVAIAA